MLLFIPFFGTAFSHITLKIFIKDVKSSNGTFINGERLSPEGLESEPYELKSDDIVVCFFQIYTMLHL
jgi:pSer/pThr/pTyr-binding forkhead associated (FHA) protein